MSRKRKKSIKHHTKRIKSGFKKDSNLMNLVLGAIAGVVASGAVDKMAKSVNVPMSATLSPLAVILGSSYFHSTYSSGMIAGSSAMLIQSLAKQYFPNYSKFVTLDGESSDPLLGAEYLYGEDQYVIQGAESDNEYVVAGGISDDPLE